MHAYVSTAAFSICLLLVAPSVIGNEEKRGQEKQTDEADELGRARHKLRAGPEETPQGPTKRHPNQHIDDHLRTEKLLDSHLLEIPDRFEKEE